MSTHVVPNVIASLGRFRDLYLKQLKKIRQTPIAQDRDVTVSTKTTSKPPQLTAPMQELSPGRVAVSLKTSSFVTVKTSEVFLNVPHCGANSHN